MNWFDVDKEGLSKLLARKGKSFAVLELLQNAWDEESSEVHAAIERIPNSPFVTLTVTDNSPAGFPDLSHAFTLFGESAKKGDETKRGRFNAGEKMTLALCSEAVIESTTGSVIFDQAGRRTSRKKRASGSMFRGVLRMTSDEVAEAEAVVLSCLPPPHIRTTFNGVELVSRTPLKEFTASLPTEKADAEGYLRRSVRTTTVRVFEPRDREIPTLFELGIPVVGCPGDRYSIDIAQKIPLTLERDNVPQSYLAKVRAVVLQHMTEHLTTNDANAPWVREAIEHHGDDLPAETIERLVGLRFGGKRVIYDPSDMEANGLAFSAGYTVIHGGQLSKAEWQAVKRVSAALPAGQVTPSRPEGTSPARYLAEGEWTPEMAAVVRYTLKLAQIALGRSIAVAIADNREWYCGASYGGGLLTFNVGRLGKRWFDPSNRERITDLIIHELAHEHASDHLSSRYYAALTAIGATLIEAALVDPGVFDLTAR